jgi:hypothetical protein
MQYLHTIVGNVFRQPIAIPISTNCTPLFADLLVLTYEYDYTATLSLSLNCIVSMKAWAMSAGVLLCVSPTKPQKSPWRFLTNVVLYSFSFSFCSFLLVLYFFTLFLLFFISSLLQNDLCVSTQRLAQFPSPPDTVSQSRHNLSYRCLCLAECQQYVRRI